MNNVEKQFDVASKSMIKFFDSLLEHNDKIIDEYDNIYSLGYNSKCLNPLNSEYNTQAGVSNEDMKGCGLPIFNYYDYDYNENNELHLNTYIGTSIKSYEDYMKLVEHLQKVFKDTLNFDQPTFLINGRRNYSFLGDPKFNKDDYDSIYKTYFEKW